MDQNEAEARAAAKRDLHFAYARRPEPATTRSTGRLIGVDRLTALVLEMRVAIEACA